MLATFNGCMVSDINVLGKMKAKREDMVRKK